jgi:hypothetical protein
MSTPTDRTPAPQIDPAAEFRGPPEEEFWERYNRRLEFPLSTVTAVLIHVLVGALLIVVLVRLMENNADKSLVPVKLVDVQGGMDDGGGGMSGSGGAPDPIAKGDADPWKLAQPALPDLNKLPDVREDIRKALNVDDPSANVPVSEANSNAYSHLDDTLRKKMLGIGQNKGAGPEAGKGDDNTKGAGPGGTGANSSRARSLRWVMRFRTASGDDYVAQLAAMGAVILVPLPPENKDCVYFTDLKNLGQRRTATDDDLKQLANQIKFSDTRPESVRAVCGVLGVKEPARSFWAFFPRGLEDELSRKEMNYRNRRAEDIEETVFRVIVRGGNFEIVVDDQTAKR